MPTTAQFNEPHLERLAEILERGGGAGLVGAGTSIACGYPGWGAFLGALEAVLERRWRAEYLEEVRQQDVRIRLDRMAHELGLNYRLIFERHFKPGGDGRNTPEWIRLLFDLNLRLLLTTNYTSELEEAAKFHPSSPLGIDPRPVRWHEGTRLYSALRRTAGLQLVYLHGRYDDSPLQRTDNLQRHWSSVILGEASYKYAYQFPGEIAKILKTVCLSHTLLIVGASLADEDIKEVLREVKATSGLESEPHYIILGRWPDQDMESKAEALLDLYGLQPIFYTLQRKADVVDHSALEDLLRNLVHRVTQKAPERPGIKIIPASAGEYPPLPRIVHPLLRAEDFEPRPQFQRPIQEFLDYTEGGVFVLVGIGGSGKTALVQEALARLLSREHKAKYDGIFVWSFYDKPDATAFMRSVAGYLARIPSLDDCSEEQAYDVFRGSCLPDLRVLFVLDGLEKLQIERANDRQSHGTLESTMLRRLLLWLVRMKVAARAIVTTRFPLPDLERDKSGGRCSLLDLDALTRPQARALLLRRGVLNSTEADLNTLLDHFGAHALTVDHLGGVIVTYLEGDACRFRELGGRPLARFEAGQAGKHLARVLAAYLGYLARDEPAVRDLLERIALFPRPVGSKLLAQIVLGPRREILAGNLIGASLLDLKYWLKRLTELRFLHEELVSQETVYSIHPALREAVMDGMGGRRRDIAATAQAGLEASLNLVEGRPGAHPLDKSILEMIEDLVGFCVDTGALERARDLYWNRLGHYNHLGWMLGEYALGERVTHRILGGLDREGSPREERSALVTERALYLESLGRLEEAANELRLNLDVMPWSGNSAKESICQQNLSEVELLLGQTLAAEISAQAAIWAADRAHDQEENRKSCARLAVAQSVRGKCREALKSFQLCREYQNAIDRNMDPLYSLRGFHFQILLLQLGRANDAMVFSKANLAIHEKNGWKDDVARSHLIQAESFRRLGRFIDAGGPLRCAREWALRSGEHELLLWALLFEVRLMRDEKRFRDAYAEVEEGLRTAETCKFGLFAIDLRNLHADISFAVGKIDSARAVALEALALSDDPACDYFWGRLEACDLLRRIYRKQGMLVSAFEFNRRTKRLRAKINHKIWEDLILPGEGWREVR